MLYNTDSVDASSVAAALSSTNSNRLYKVSSEGGPTSYIMANSPRFAMLFYTREYPTDNVISVEYVSSPGTYALIWAESGTAYLYVDKGKTEEVNGKVYGALTEIGALTYTDFKVKYHGELGVYLVSFDGLPYFVATELMGDPLLVAEMM